MRRRSRRLAAEKKFSALAEAVNPLLKAVRADGTCLLCKAPAGTQHTAKCPATPFILARASLVHTE